MKNKQPVRDTPFSPEEALKVIPNRFEMTLVAAEKARQLKKQKVENFRTEALKEISRDMIGEDNG